ncbi:MAG: hypothetical protein WC679_00720 [Bacteroidales bacterium]|jgi:hypothetical protein
MKSFYQYITELNLYRGVGDGSDDKYITWYTIDKKLAQGYADKRNNSKLITTTINLKKVIDLFRDNYTLTPSSFVSIAIKNTDISTIDIEQGKIIRKNFIDYFGPMSREVIHYWKDSKSKQQTAIMLKFFGFDAIRITEDGIDTYGILN